MHWRWVLLFGLFQGVGQFGFLFMGLKVGMTAGLASVLLQTQVFFTALLGFALLRERPGLPLRVGMGLAALGLVCFAMNYVGPGSGVGVGGRHHAGGPAAHAVWRGDVGVVQHRGTAGAAAQSGV